MKNIPVKKRHWLLYNFLFFVEHFLGANLFRKLFSKLENRLISQIQKYPADFFKPSDFKIIDLKEGEYDKPIYDKWYPIVFRNAAKNWECCKEWSIDFFEKEYGDIMVTMQDNIGLTDKDNPQTFSYMKMSEYIQELRSGSKKYLKFSKVIEDKEILEKYFDTKWIDSSKRSTAFSNSYYFFIGGKDTKTPIHNGFAGTVFIQVEGQKKWLFYAPEDRIFLGIRPERRSYNYSNANPYNLQDPKYPLLKYAQKHEVILNPGDILWFNSLIFHQVENMSDSIGVACKFNDIPLSFKSSKIMSTLFFLATKPSLLTAFIGKRTEKNDYIFVKNKDEFKHKQEEVAV
jgi:hypothetical protein